MFVPQFEQIMSVTGRALLSYSWCTDCQCKMENLSLVIGISRLAGQRSWRWCQTDHLRESGPRHTFWRAWDQIRRASCIPCHARKKRGLSHHDPMFEHFRDIWRITAHHCASCAQLATRKLRRNSQLCVAQVLCLHHLPPSRHQCTDLRKRRTLAQCQRRSRYCGPVIPRDVPHGIEVATRCAREWRELPAAISRAHIGKSVHSTHEPTQPSRATHR
ncbi:hypothetical protein EDB89DRAFT_1058700 [Lactarius sanguifluus]|nr:hypothetical protein EDB89DRAFT_1058700 [Lactarius sanguifluus]